jgi:hypothetical protein
MTVWESRNVRAVGIGWPDATNVHNFYLTLRLKRTDIHFKSWNEDTYCSETTCTYTNFNLFMPYVWIRTKPEIFLISAIYISDHIKLNALVHFPFRCIVSFSLCSELHVTHAYCTEFLQNITSHITHHNVQYVYVQLYILYMHYHVRLRMYVHIKYVYSIHRAHVHL